MKAKLFTLSLLVFLITSIKDSNAQPEFTITISGHYWTDASVNSSDAFINIHFTVNNRGNVGGYNEDIPHIYLDADSPYDARIRLDDYDSDILRFIPAKKSVSGYLRYRVPKNAKNIYLRFSEKGGGASKFITSGYQEDKNELNRNLAQERFEEGVKEMRSTNYEKAIAKFKVAFELDNTLKSIVDENVILCLENLALKNESNKKYQDAIFNYEQLLKMKNDSKYKEKISGIYERMGDESWQQKPSLEALRLFERANTFKYDSRLTNKINSYKSQLDRVSAETQRQQKLARDNKAYNELVEPRLTTRLTVGIAYSSLNTENKSSTNLMTFEGNILYKLFTERESKFTGLINTELGAFLDLNDIGESSNDQFANRNFAQYFGLDFDQIKSGTNPFQGYSGNVGLGFTFLVKGFTPYAIANLGYRLYLINKEIFNPNLGSTIEYKLLGGLFQKYTLGFKIGSSKYGFDIAYSLSPFTINDKWGTLQREGLDHKFSLGIIGL